MFDALSNDDTVKIFKYCVRVYNIKNSLNLPYYGNSRECPVWICCSSVTSTVVLAESTAAHILLIAAFPKN